VVVNHHTLITRRKRPDFTQYAYFGPVRAVRQGPQQPDLAKVSDIASIPILHWGTLCSHAPRIAESYFLPLAYYGVSFGFPNRDREF
jgi:hypothetical protein